MLTSISKRIFYTVIIFSVVIFFGILGLCFFIFDYCGGGFPSSIGGYCEGEKNWFCITWMANNYSKEMLAEVKCDEEGRKLLEMACGKGSGDYYCVNNDTSKKVLLPVENGCYWNYVYNLCSRYGIIVKTKDDCINITGKE
jgi:hypothetical protein